MKNIYQKLEVEVLNFLDRFSISSVSSLLVVSVVLVGGLILLTNMGALPIVGVGNFVFFAALVLLFALYRPVWAFWLFVGLLPLETVNLAPLELGLTVRTYQLFGALLLVALGIRWVGGRLEKKCFTWNWADTTVILMIAGGFVATINAPDFLASFQQAIIVASFASLYFLTRYFVRGPVSVIIPVKFFLSSASVVALYGIWQNWRFAQDLSSFATMPGRPNATFAEPDWLGLWLVAVISIVYVSWYFVLTKKKQIFQLDLTILEFVQKYWQKYYLVVGLWAFLTIIYTLLILTVARSAWLGALAVTVAFAIFVLVRRQWRLSAKLVAIMGSALIVSLLLVAYIPLTDFHLGARAVSTGGTQSVTVACADETATTNLRNFLTKQEANKLDDVAQLSQFDCVHINLQDIEKEKNSGKIVFEVPRNDPSIAIRAEIYYKTKEIMKESWLLGIGWGSVGHYLGTDTHGNALNSSNIFAQIWLGAGLIGLFAFIAIIIGICHATIKRLTHSRTTQNTAFALGVTLVIIAIIIPNLFNAGALMGYIWVLLGASTSVIYRRR